MLLLVINEAVFHEISGLVNNHLHRIEKPIVGTYAVWLCLGCRGHEIRVCEKRYVYASHSEVVCG